VMIRFMLLGKWFGCTILSKPGGLYEFAKDRYGSFDGNTKSFDPALSNEENIQKKYLMYG